MKFVFLITLAGLSGAGFAQEKLQAITPYSRNITPFCCDTAAHNGFDGRGGYQSLPGIVVLKKGDSLSGCMYIFHYRGHSRNQGVFFDQNDGKYRLIKAEQIKKIELQLYTLHRMPTEIYTMNLKHMKGAFWRLIESKGKYAVYDHCAGIYAAPEDEVWANNTSKNYFNEFMYIVSADNHVEKVYGRFSIDKTAREKLLKYINKKYNRQFRQTDFETQLGMVDYILTRENAASSSLPPK